MAVHSRLFLLPLVFVIPVFLYWRGDWRRERSTANFTEVISSLQNNSFSYLDRVVVFAYLRDLSEPSWIRDLPASISTTIYPIDDLSYPTEVPRNKSHEAVVYLSYIIDHYHSLPPMAIFVHQTPQRAATYPSLLDFELGKLVTNLSKERVQREGYMNLRCQLEPGCGEDILQLHKGREGLDDTSDEKAIKDNWSELFHNNVLPKTLSSPISAQFAVSQEKLSSIPLARYSRWLNWLLTTSLPDDVAARIWSHLWHYIFTSQTTLCPDPYVCFCDGYGLCFASSADLQDWMVEERELRKVQGEYDEWKSGRRVVADVEKSIEFKGRIRDLKVGVERRLEEAWEKGRDVEGRRKVLGGASGAE